MKALVLTALQMSLEYKEVSIPEPKQGEVLIRVEAAALNHRDVYITQGLYPRIQLPVILGSDGSGEVVAVGEGGDVSWIGKKVIVDPGSHWGGAAAHQSLQYQILGMPANGFLAEYVCVRADGLVERPAHLTAEQAAALPLGGLTAYRALCTRAAVQRGERVLVSGIGGGVALFALQFAMALGAEVYVTSGDEAKISQAMALGAAGGVNYRQEGWHKTLATMAGGGFDVIIDSAGGDGFGALLDLANFGGRIAMYGGTKGNFVVNPQKLFWKQLSLLGSTMGSPQDFEQMIGLVQATQIVPVIDSVWQLAQGNEAFARMADGKQFGKIVLTTRV